jgi:hypothetical protein
VDEFGKWIKFALVEKKAKTNVWNIETDEGIVLGQIKWFGRWRTYALYPSPDTVFEDDCLLDMANFIKKQMDERKKK